jgi:hypothetical protein
MSAYNFLNYDGTLTPSTLCKYDSNIAYEADFSHDGEVDGWEFYDGIHTYGCWNHFLFGTLYDTYALIGRYTPITPVEAEKFYMLRLVMKIALKERSESVVYTPTHGRIAWKTLASPVWNSDKELDFEIAPDDGGWHTYNINMGEAQWWQGDISDLRIYPILEHGVDGDEFYIRTIEILSVSEYRCTNVSCDYYTRYEHNCPGIGERGYCKSEALPSFVREGTIHEFAEDKYYTIEEGVNDTLLVNMNGYGFENVVLDPTAHAPGQRIANSLSKEISRLDVGGYAEAVVEYTSRGEFVIYNGVYAGDSTVEIGDSPLARDLNFFDDKGKDISTKHVGRYPATGFAPYSAFRMKTHQIYALLDESTQTEFYFNPFIYNVEGGRQDWLDIGLGRPTVDVRTGETDDSGTQDRYYEIINNEGRTIIDFTHPFNASGRIVKIFSALTLDTVAGEGWQGRGAHDANRINTQLKDAKIMFFRPLKDGTLRVLDREVPIQNREHEEGKLYSSIQEYVDLDCDIFVNKGDLIGIYNANIYKSRSLTGRETDALYYQVDGEAKGELLLRQPQGHGNGGLLIYARSDLPQNRLLLDLDLGQRINVEKIRVVGASEQEILEYNVARCLDIEWEVDLFGHHHGTGWIRQYRPLKKAYYSHPNVAFGFENLTDGIKTVPDGLAADDFDVELPDHGYRYYNQCYGKKDGGIGVIPTNPKYFWVNGDVEWLATYHHANRNSPFIVGDFNSDPIAFTLRFPFEKKKRMYKMKVFFKDQYNFRSFALSTFRGEFYTDGNADDPRFELIPYKLDGSETPWDAVVLDGLEYTPDSDSWGGINLYLAHNPTIGHRITEEAGIAYTDGGMFEGVDMSYYDEMGGASYTQNFRTVNNDQYQQAVAVDWTILELRWPDISDRGFRFYCNNHKSTKICELELYCLIENVESAMAGSVDMTYSSYGEDWWPAEKTETDYGVSCFVGDTPQHISILVQPITEIKLSDIIVDVSYEDVYMGEKGCQYTFIPSDAKRGVDNPSEKIEFKNVYGRDYDLYVDIASPELVDDGTVFFSTMSSQEAIENPEIGADAYYRKHEDYLLEHYQKNVAINCPVYSLKNLVDGADVWYSYDDGYSWKHYGVVEEGNELNFSNLPDAAITTINLPVLVRSKYWKIGFFDPRVVMSVREIQIYYQDEEIFGIQFYHHKDADVYTTRQTDTAPHLKNDIIDGSYYVLKGDHHIGFELPAVQNFDRIVLYHDYLLPYENSHNKAGIDKATVFCIHGNGTQNGQDQLVDASYYEHAVTVEGPGIYSDRSETSFSYSFTEDFSECKQETQHFDGPDIDTSFWTSIENAAIVSGTLALTNSGISGEVSTIEEYYGDFTATVRVTVSGAYDAQGWGCYLEAFTADGYRARVGKTFEYFSSNQVIAGNYYTDAGWLILGQYTVEESNDDLVLQMQRQGNETKFSGGIYGELLRDIGTTTVLGYGPVRLKLLSRLTPLAPPETYTIGLFDDFHVATSATDWENNLSDSSEFTCVSGIGPTGHVSLFDMACRNSSNAGSFKRPKPYDNSRYPFDEETAFVFDFSFQMDELLNQYGSEDAAIAVSIGVLGNHVRYQHTGAHPWRRYFTGAQLAVGSEYVTIAIRNEWTDGAESSKAYFDTSAMPYFARLTCSGNGHYEAHIWSDDWDGSNKVAELSLESDLRWTAGRVGYGSGAGHSYYNWLSRATGWVSDFSFNCTKTHKNYRVNDSTIRFSGVPGERIVAAYENSPLCNYNHNNLHFGRRRYTIDFNICFNTLPPNDGDVITIISSWNHSQPMYDNAPVLATSSWALVLENEGGGYVLKFFINNNHSIDLALEYAFNPDCHRWHHFYICRGANNNMDYITICRDGHFIDYVNRNNSNIIFSGEDLVIGENFDGHMEEIRVSCDEDGGGARLPTYFNYKEYILKNIPTLPYERYYTMSFYESTTGSYYGKNFDVDVLFDNSLSYHVAGSIWSSTYYTYLAIDFGQRHDIAMVRSFPKDTSYQFTRTDNILYSNKDVSDPMVAFSLTESEKDLDTDFTGMYGSYPPTFRALDSDKAKSYIVDDTFYMVCNSTGAQELAHAEATFIFYGDYDFYIDYGLSETPPTSSDWQAIIELIDVNEPDKVGYRAIRGLISGNNMHRVQVKDNSSTWVTISEEYLDAKRNTIRVQRENKNINFFTKDIDDDVSAFRLKSIHQMNTSKLSPEMRLSLTLTSEGPGFPTSKVWWDNFVVLEANPIFSTSQDARWAKIKMLNGDGTLRTVESVGMYPDIMTRLNAWGQANCKWEPLGTSITSYAEAENLALGATISGSSYVGLMYPWNANDGLIPEGVFDSCWGAFHDDENGMWLSVYFNEVKEIYRVKLFHGYADEDFNNLITDYKIQTSLDGETFTTIFDISNNKEMVRIHDLSYGVSAKVVRLWIDDYDAINRFVYTGPEDGYQFWMGPLLREIEIYEYYGFTVINSEDSPIIAIDLTDPFFVEGHELIGVDAENPDLNWAHDDSDDPNYDEDYIGDGPGVQFAWSNSHHTNPSKVTFSDWGADPGYAKWAVIKRNTATHYPRVPIPERDYDDTPDFLKHAVIKASVDQKWGNAPNPVEYPWFWRSNISELSHDYDTQTNTGFIVRSLRIDYPASTEVEHIRYIPGDHFGWDDVASWRDGFGFFLYIDDVDNLDLEYGYFYLGGHDYTSQRNPIEHRWNMTTFSGILKSGWNNLNLTFLYSDALVYTELADFETGRDPRRLYSINWGKMGFIFRGKGNPLTLNFEGFFIERNHFEHGCLPGQRGLYLHAGDVLKVPTGELDMHSGSIEYFIRPDWNWDGRDRYNDFKFRALFHFGNVANDVIGAAISAEGIQVYYGNLLEDFNVFTIPSFASDAIEQLIHMAFVFSNDGSSIGTDKSTIRVYINNELIAKHFQTWKVTDNKHFNFSLGGQGMLTLKANGFDPTSSAVDGVINNLKIHNYCKTDYSNSMPDFTGANPRRILKPDQFIAISKDNVTFHKVGSPYLPFFFDDVPAGESIPIWYRVHVPRFGITGREKRTAGIMGSWDIGV